MKFADIQKEIPLRKSDLVDGLYMRGVAISVIDEFEATKATTDEILLWCFKNIFCDKDGQPFEDIETVDDIKQYVEMDVAVELLNESHRILGIAGKESATDPSDNSNSG